MKLRDVNDGVLALAVLGLAFSVGFIIGVTVAALVIA